MKCPLCERGEHTYNPWIPNNEKLIEFIRWREIGAVIVICVSFYVIMGVIGILVGSLFYHMMGIANGGAMADWFGEFPKQELKIKQRKCPLGHKDCKYTAVRLN